MNPSRTCLNEIPMIYVDFGLSQNINLKLVCSKFSSIFLRQQRVKSKLRLNLEHSVLLTAVLSIPGETTELWRNNSMTDSVHTRKQG